NTRSIITTACTVVGELFSFRSIYEQVAGLNVLSNDLTSVYFFTWIYKEGAPVLQLINRISRSSFLVFGDQYTVVTAGDLSFPGLVCYKAMRHYCFTGSRSQHLCTQTDQTT